MNRNDDTTRRDRIDATALDDAGVRIGGPSVAYVRWADLKRSDRARRQVDAARALARRLKRAA